MDLFTLAAKLTVDSSEFTKGLQDANTKGSNLSSKLSGVINVAKKVAGALVFKKGVESLKALADQAAKAGDRIDKQSQALGMSRQAFQEWDYILSQSGASIDSLGVAMKTMNTNILEGKDSVGKLGLSFEDLKKMSPEQQFDAVVKAFQQMPEGAEKSALAVEMFGKQGQSLLPLLNSSSESIDALRQKFSDLGIAMTDDMIDSAVHYTDAMDTMNRTLDAAKIMIGSELLPVMTDWITHATNYAGKLVSAYKEGGISEVFNTLKGDFEGFVQSLKENDNPVLQTMGKALDILLQTVETIVGLFTDFPGTIEKLKQSDNPILQLLAGSIENLKNIFDITVGLITDFPGTVEKLKSSDNPVLQVLGNSIEVVRTILETVIGLFTDFPGTIQRLKESDSPVLQLIAAAFEGVKTVVQTVIDIANSLPGVWDTVSGKLGEIWGAIKTTATTIWNAISETAGTVWTAISSAVTTAIDTASSILSGLWTDIKSAATLAWDFLSTTASSVWNTISSAISVAIAVASELLSGLWEGIKTAATTVWDFLNTTATSVWNAISSAITAAISSASGLLSEIWNIVKTTAEGIWNGLKVTAKTAWNAIRDFIRNPIETANSMLSALWQLIKSGAESVWNGLKATAETVWNSIKDFIYNPINSAQSLLSGLWDGIKETATSTWEAIKSTANTVWNSIKSFITDPITTAKNTLATIWTTMRTVAQSAWDTFKGVIEAAVAPVKAVIDGVADAVQGVIDWFNQLLGFDGKNLASTTSSHTHTETTIINTINKATGGAVGTVTEKVGGAAVEALTGGKMTKEEAGGIFDSLLKITGIKQAKGNWNVPYDDYPSLLHRGEMVLTASQARKYRDNESGIDYGNLAQVVAQAVREGMAGVSVNSYLDAELVTESVNRRIGNELVSRRYAT